MSYALVIYFSIATFILVVLSSYKTIADTKNPVMGGLDRDFSPSWASIIIVSVAHPIIALVLIGITLYGIFKEDKKNTEGSST